MRVRQRREKVEKQRVQKIRVRLSELYFRVNYIILPEKSPATILNFSESGVPRFTLAEEGTKARRHEGSKRDKNGCCERALIWHVPSTSGRSISACSTHTHHHA